MKTNHLKSTLLSAITAMLCLTANAQAPEWSWAIDTHGSDSEFSSELATGVGQTVYATISFTGSFSIGGIEILSPPQFNIGTLYAALAKFEGPGEVEWVIPLPDPELGYALYTSGLATDSDNNVYITGQVNRENAAGDFAVDVAGVQFVVPEGISSDGFIAKIDPDGNGLWVRNLGTPETPLNDIQAFAVAIDENDHIYFSGTFAGSIEIDDSLHTSMGQRDIFLTRLDVEGNFMWSSTLGSIEEDFFAVTAPAIGGGLLMSGMWSNETVHVGGLSVTNPNPMIGTNYDRWVAKINEDGTAAWLKREGGLGNDVPGKPVSTPTGGAMVFSRIGSPLVLNGQSYNQQGYLLTRYSSEGELEQVSNYPAGIGNNYIGSDGNDNYFLVWDFSTPTASFGEFQITNNGGITETSDLLIGAVDGTGTPLWALGVGTPQNDAMRGINFSQSQGLLVAGSFNGSALFLGDHLLENTGFFTADFFLAALDFTTSVTNAPGVQPLHLYPNPAEFHVSVDLSSLSAQQHILRIFDTRGSLVLSQIVMGGGVETLEVSNLPKGSYVMIIHVDGVVHASKFIKL